MRIGSNNISGKSHATQRSKSRVINSRAGISLLEVVLALAILATSAALLAQITRQATNNALMAQRIASAQLICEGTMSEILVGAIPMQTTGWTPVDGSFSRGNWYYKLDTVNAERPNMIGLRLAITDIIDSPEGEKELFYVVRWVIDPSLGLDTPPTPDASGSSGSSGASSGSSGTGGTGSR
jgi:type II secretory pathway pseudopilin PulG